MGALKALWAYRHFVISSIRNELISQFARSKLGGLWMIINPLAQVAIYALILSNVLAAKLPGVEGQYAYAIYLIAGLLAWTLFNEIVSRSTNLFIAQGNLLKKMSFPRITLPAITVGSCVLNNFLLFIAALGVFVFLGHQFTLAMFWLLPLAMVVVAFGVGLGLTLGVLNVFLRDIGQFMTIVLQMWFWFTPIVYPATIIPEQYRHLLDFNPVYPLTHAYQQVLVYGQAPSFDGMLTTIGIAVALLATGLFLFRRASEEMVDVL
jgi:lipopolysaccharide transport system permease protein